MPNVDYTRITHNTPGAFFLHSPFAKHKIAKALHVVYFVVVVVAVCRSYFVRAGSVCWFNIF